MTQTSLQPDLALAIDIAREAGSILREGVARADSRTVEFKSSAVDPVTEYDRRSEHHIVTRLRERFPGDAVVGEEGGAYAGGAGSPRQWHVDPLDGTVNFAHGVPIFSVSLGLLIDGVPSLGVVYNPMSDELYTALRGKGAHLNGRPIRVSATYEMSRALLATGFPYDRQTSPINNFEHFVRFKRTVQAVRRLGSAALDLCFVACGRFDGYWELKIQPHDIAGGLVILREAGGRASTFGGDDRTETLFARREVVASNLILHDAMLDILANEAGSA